MLQDLADARVSLTGHATAMPQEREDAVKLVYKSKNPESFWADFGDFKPFYMEDVVAVHFNGGFGRAGRKVRPAQPPSCIMHQSYEWARHTSAVVYSPNNAHSSLTKRSKAWRNKLCSKSWQFVLCKAVNDALRW